LLVAAIAPDMSPAFVLDIASAMATMVAGRDIVSRWKTPECYVLNCAKTATKL
jgi:hypothetical protein